MSIALQGRVSVLENRLSVLEERIKTLEDMLKMEDIKEPEAFAAEGFAVEGPAPTRAMCPKCGVKPAYFFHVKHCKGSK